MKTAVRVPLVDLRAQYDAIRQEIDSAIARVVGSAAFIGGAEVDAFAHEFAAYCGAADAVGVANGTDALTLALRAAGVGPGDEVITTSHTFIATVEAIVACGATPVLVEIRPDTMLVDVAAAAAAVTPRTKAIVAVHLYGQCCDMDALQRLASRHGLVLVEDAAQAHGAEWRGVRAGVLGDLAAFSFYPGKNLGAYGDGGAVVGKDAALVRRVRRLANHGRAEKYLHDEMGVNSRLDALQAAILRVKLDHLDEWNGARRAIAAAYQDRLSATIVELPAVDAAARHAWHLYVIRTAQRDRVRDALRAAGVETGIHYPVPVHQQPAWQAAGRPALSLPITERTAASILSLPIFPELGADAIDHITSVVSSALRS
jgi:dTDP-4-amino-4,6-dideoxygalactose transaminase